MKGLPYIVIGFGVLNIVLGAEAYLAKGSLPSLMGGGAIGLLAVVGGIVAMKKPTIGYVLGMISALAIVGRFWKPALQEGKVYPGMVMFFSALFVIAALAYGHFASKKLNR